VDAYEHVDMETIRAHLGVGRVWVVRSLAILGRQSNAMYEASCLFNHCIATLLLFVLVVTLKLVFLHTSHVVYEDNVLLM
jgi:hypothetical protein